MKGERLLDREKGSFPKKEVLKDDLSFGSFPPKNEQC